jgi:DNA topoisomerase-3
MFSSIISSSSSIVCYDIKQAETRRVRPIPLNTVELLKIASRSLGIGPQAAMRAAEYLYLSGYISYPRTESTSYPKSFDIKDAIGIMREHPDYGKYCQQLLSK